MELNRTPVREALGRLVASGMLNLITNRGVFVSELTAQDIVEVYQLRETLETWETNRTG